MFLKQGPLQTVDAAEARFPASLSLCNILVGTMGGLGFSVLSPNATIYYYN